ncbi:hypothetical protein LCM4577_16495 [Mesorhizobium sp. LCM 4577]|uniref:DUF2278 family protein n=1 Tax=Mesorhizobium sp. LCM 4577 TaxID=1848288 RepID=UPI0008D8DF5C|nr:DUF2278 family protein [Mesorhizobium sp. LCM 4577]OHV60341.1 hypothetical protein LCM4577_16495 [Mesorhizobium sp. LCM 4577]
MALEYGFAKGKVSGPPVLRAKPLGHEIQYHLHVPLDVAGASWDVAINVGTNDSDDLLQYKLAFDFHHSVIKTLVAAPMGRNDLTGQGALPALDFMRSDILAETGRWRLSDPMDGSMDVEPAASMNRLLRQAAQNRWNVYVFGRFYKEGDGIHDTHMNQGSTGAQFAHRQGDDRNDHNDVWQDGAVLVASSQELWAAYFAAFENQLVPTDELGNPTAHSKPVG